MRGLFPWAVAGIALFFGGAVLVILLATGSPRPAAEAVPPAEAPLAPPAPVDRGPPPPAIPPAPAAEAPAEAPPARPIPPAGWEQARTLQIPDETAMRELALPLGPCLERYGRGAGAQVVRLRLEAIPGGLRIVDAQPVERDAAAEPLIDCTQGILRDRKLSLGGFQPGERFEASYLLGEGGPLPAVRQGGGNAGGARIFRRQRGKGTSGGP